MLFLRLKDQLGPRRVVNPLWFHGDVHLVSNYPNSYFIT